MITFDTLLEIFTYYGCDKGISGKYPHHYHTVYEPAFEPYRDEPINILEVGIWEGRSHQSWIAYFPNAQVYGIDIFTRVKEKDCRVLNHERMHHLNASSTKPKLGNKVKNAFGENIQFDIIIDDGLHSPLANKLTFQQLYPFLKEGGSYFIEDVWFLENMTQEAWDSPWMKDNPKVYNMENHNALMSVLPNYIEHDNRELSGILDSFIMEIKK
tara:strand:+ start:1906 stop:2544 length:639 start_codon:yes stop_codon:yes gene_type:complete